MRILAIGDIVGEPGVEAAEALVAGLREEFGANLVVANGENAAKQGVGITRRVARRLLDCGIDALTLGNHALRQHDVFPLLNDPEAPIVRPANLPAGAPGRGCVVVEAADGTQVAVLNVLGNLFIESASSPFEVVDSLVAETAGADVVLVDVHAEATSEKLALAQHLAGRVTAVVGTHTHVQTSDARILAGGTAYITDLGMTGPHDSVIGVRSEIVLKRFRTGIGQRFEVAHAGVQLEGAIIDADPSTATAEAIQAFRRPLARG